MAIWAFSTSLRNSAVNSTTRPSPHMYCVHLSIIRSGAPFIYIVRSLSSFSGSGDSQCTWTWYLFLLLKGMSKTLPWSLLISSTSLFPKQAWMGPPCANLIMAPSEALPRVFQRISVMVLPSPCTLTLLNGNNTRLPVTSSSKYLSKLQVLHNVEHFTSALKPADSLSYVLMPFVKEEPASWIFG